MAIRDCSKVIEILQYETLDGSVDIQKLKFKAYIRRAESLAYFDDVQRAEEDLQDIEALDQPWSVDPQIKEVREIISQIKDKKIEDEAKIDIKEGQKNDDKFHEKTEEYSKVKKDHDGENDHKEEHTHEHHDHKEEHAHEHQEHHDHSHHAHDHTHYDHNLEQPGQEKNPFKAYDLPISLERKSSIDFLQSIILNSSLYPQFLSSDFLNLKNDSNPHKQINFFMYINAALTLVTPQEKHDFLDRFVDIMISAQ